MGSSTFDVIHFRSLPPIILPRPLLWSDVLAMVQTSFNNAPNRREVRQLLHWADTSLSRGARRLDRQPLSAAAHMCAVGSRWTRLSAARHIEKLMIGPSQEAASPTCQDSPKGPQGSRPEAEETRADSQGACLAHASVQQAGQAAEAQIVQTGLTTRSVVASKLASSQLLQTLTDHRWTCVRCHVPTRFGCCNLARNA